jgi:hypothetical protein
MFPVRLLVTTTPLLMAARTLRTLLSLLVAVGFFNVTVGFFTTSAQVVSVASLTVWLQPVPVSTTPVVVCSWFTDRSFPTVATRMIRPTIHDTFFRDCDERESSDTSLVGARLRRTTSMTYIRQYYILCCLRDL